MLAGTPPERQDVSGSVANSYGNTFSVALKEPAASGDEEETNKDTEVVYRKSLGAETNPNPASSSQIDTEDRNKEEDTVDALMVEALSFRERLQIFLVQSLCYFHCGAQSGIYLVIPYYVASTPEHGWTVSDLSIIFAVFNVGGIVAAQISMLAGSGPHSERILSIGHCSQFVMGIVGFVIMSSIMGFNLPLFYVGAFLGGFSTDCTTIESYGALISDREEVQSRLLGSIGKVFLIAGILNSFLLPAIYESAGFLAFCFACCALNLIALCALALLWVLILKDRPNAAGKGNTVDGKEEVRDDSVESDSPSLQPICGPTEDAEAASMPAAGVKPKMDTIDSTCGMEPDEKPFQNPTVPELTVNIGSPQARDTAPSRWTPLARDAARSGWSPNVRRSMALSRWSPRAPLQDTIRFRAMTHSRFAAISVVSPRTRRTRGISMYPDTVHEEDDDQKWLTAPVAVLLVAVFISAVTGSMYVASFPLPFAEDFGIHSTVGGYLDAAANVFSFLVLTVFLKYSSSSVLCRYPYDMVLIAAMFAVGNLLFMAFYAEWIAYSVHWIIRRIVVVLMGCEMVSRLYLCPPAAFGKVTSIGGLLKTIGYVVGAAVGPLLFSLNHRLPFAVMAVLNIILVVVVCTVYLLRKRVLSLIHFDEDTKGQYLLMERALNNKHKSEAHQQMDKEHVSMLQRTVRRSVTASDVVWVKS